MTPAASFGWRGRPILVAHASCSAATLAIRAGRGCATTGWIFRPTCLWRRTTVRRAAAQPLFVLFSVGTRQRHVSARNEATARHPLPDVVTAFRNQNSVILCTQISWRCHDDPENVPGNSVIPLPSVIDPHALSPSGSACAGTIMLVLRGTGHLVVSRLTDPQAAVDALQPTGHHP